MILDSSLSLKNVKIIKFEENNGYLQVILANNSPSAICPTCKTPSTSVKDYRLHRIIDKPAIELFPIQLFFQKRRFRCYISSCPTKTFTEVIPGLPKKHIYTQQFKDLLSNMYKHMDFPTIKKRLSDNYKLNIPISTIWYKLKDEIKDFYPQSNPIQAQFIGIDDFSYAKGHTYGVVLIKIVKNNKELKSQIIDMVAGGKTTDAAKSVLNSVDPAYVLACCMDFWDPFRTAVRFKLPNADIVVDRFHVIKLFNDSIQLLINRICPTLSNDNKELLIENKFKLILKGRERLTDSTSHDLQSILLINQELESIYTFKERFRSLYLINDINIVKDEFRKWLYQAKSSNIPELISVANTYSDWFVEIINYWLYHITNSFCEGQINKIRTIQSKAYHYRNFHTLRYNVLRTEL